ncbi:MAG: TraB domain-containing protein [Planctomycetota bacterium]|nr:TraB domain-containing protein [Planctomycetota bacterium]
MIDVDERLRLVGTAHVSTQSVELVRRQIEEWSPDLVAVELCPSRMAALTEPDSLESEDLLKIINEGKSAMILLQSALAAQQRRLGITAGEQPGAELLAAIEAAEGAEIPIELIDLNLETLWETVKTQGRRSHAPDSRYFLERPRRCPG